MFGSPDVNFGPEQRLAGNESILSQIKGGRWEVVQKGIMY